MHGYLVAVAVMPLCILVFVSSQEWNSMHEWCAENKSSGGCARGERWNPSVLTRLFIGGDENENIPYSKARLNQGHTVIGLLLSSLWDICHNEVLCLLAYHNVNVIQKGTNTSGLFVSFQQSSIQSYFIHISLLHRSACFLLIESSALSLLSVWHRGVAGAIKVISQGAVRYHTQSCVTGSQASGACWQCR